MRLGDARRGRNIALVLEVLGMRIWLLLGGRRALWWSVLGEVQARRTYSIVT